MIPVFIFLCIVLPLLIRRQVKGPAWLKDGELLRSRQIIDKMPPKALESVKRTIRARNRIRAIRELRSVMPTVSIHDASLVTLVVEYDLKQ